MLAKFSGKIYPNGEYGLSRVRERPLHEICPVLPPDRWEVEAFSGRDEGGAIAIRYGREFWRGAVPPFGSSIRFNSHTPKSSERKKRGMGGITPHGSKLVRNAAYKLEQDSGRGILSFLTLTLPSMSLEEWKLVLENWSQIVRILIQKLRRKLLSRNLSPSICGVVEIQEKRLSRTGELALHLHLVFQGRVVRKAWSISPVEFQDMWSSSAIARVPSLGRLYWGASTRVESIRKSCEGYLGKYLSKGKKAVQAIPEEIREYLPSSWYVCTIELRRVVKRETRSGTEVGTLLISLLESDRETYFRTVRTIDITMPGGRNCTVGWYGRISPYFAEMLSLWGVVSP